MALKRGERLPRIRLTESGSRRSFAYGSLRLLPPPPGGAVVVSKKVFKTAPARNRVRRRFSALLQTLIRTKKLTKSVIVYPNQASLRATPKELSAALSAALR